ncbi:tetratricopeptide repeat protein [Mesorhizobium sp. A623]
MQHSTPAAPAVRETLERVLASETFARSERARELLRYLVDRQQAGGSARLKGFAIAVDVFGKDNDFDSSTDAVVRVQAGRLRELLTQYFATEGVSERLRITIPRGSYVPAYEANAVPVPASLALDENLAGAVIEETTAVAASKRRRGLIGMPSMARQLPFFWAAITLVIVMLGVLIVRQGGSLSPDGVEMARADIAATSSIAAPQSSTVLPVVYLSVKAKGEAADRIASSLRAGLSGFDTIDFIGRNISGSPDPVADASSFVFQILPGQSADSVTVELENVATGRVLLSQSLDAANALPQKIDDGIASILTATVPASGTIYNYIEQNGLQKGLTRCLLLDEKYYLDQNAATHEPAYRCLENLVAKSVKSPLVYSEIASLHLEAVTKHYAYPAGATADQAFEFARRAIHMGSTSAAVHRSFGYLKSRQGESESAIHWMHKAYQLNPYDLGMAAGYGYSLIFAGKYGEGTPILARAVEATSAHPTWWNFGLFVGKFMQGDMAGARKASDALMTTAPKSHYLAARIISAKAFGDDAELRELKDTLTQQFPRFVANPRKVFAERNYPADLTDRLIDALHEAGIFNAS